MVTQDRIDRFYNDVGRLGLKFPGAAISKATGASKGNVSQILSKKLEPSESFLNKFYEAFKESFTNVPNEVREPVTEYGFKDKYIASLERENARLQKDLDLSLGELRHNILMTRAISITNQHFLAELLAKQRKEDLTQVRLEINKVNGENYKKAKAEGKFADVGS